ncbi:hypothetical protein Acr_14g0006870 [Actinidia rufa]|uniref:Integrase catalytic domain-containing protein n=1 Tax=Actinidia rufa TaxID=165716 RepID=A0A7J0FQQ5_9ERIC|nr:hypothetical protein Acr_14g0006870 [Actinidia rufa]
MTIKAQALANFIAEFTHDVPPKPEHGCGAGLAIQTPSGDQMEYAIRIGFKATNNEEAEYEALLARLKVTTKLGVECLDVFSDSQLVVDARTNLASTFDFISDKSIPLEFLPNPSSKVAKHICQAALDPTWIGEITTYLRDGTLHQISSKHAKYNTELPDFASSQESCTRDRSPKWIETKLFAKITEKNTRNFIWKNIIYRFGIPKVIISDNARQFNNNRIKQFCSDLAISHYFSSLGHLQANGQVEVTNQKILRNLKARLDKSKDEWVEDLPSILWAYHPMSRIPTGETPFSMVYGSESVIPVELGMLSFKISNFDKENNETELRLNLDLLDEKRERAKLCQAACKLQIAKYYNRRVKPRSFLPGELVLRKVTLSTKELNARKFGPTWEGPYKVVKVSKPGTYWLEDMSGKALPHPWNAEHLKKY